MREEFKIEINPCCMMYRIRRETRDIVLRNFQEYNKEDLYTPINKLMWGLMAKIGENDNYMLLRGTSVANGNVEYYVFNKKKGYICLCIVAVYEHSISLKNNHVVLSTDFDKGSLTIGFYMINKKDLYNHHPIETIHPYANEVKYYDNDYSCIKYRNKIYITNKLPSKEYMRDHELEKTDVYFYLITD